MLTNKLRVKIAQRRRSYRNDDEVPGVALMCGFYAAASFLCLAIMSAETGQTGLDSLVTN